MGTWFCSASMYNMKKIFVAGGVVNAICLVTLILFAGVQIPAFGMWFYRWQYGLNGTYEAVNMQPADLHEVTHHMIRYMQGREPDLQIMTTVGGGNGIFSATLRFATWWMCMNCLRRGFGSKLL